MPICKYRFVIGDKMGQKCRRHLRGEGPYCYAHKSKAVETQERYKDKIKETLKVKHKKKPKKVKIIDSDDESDSDLPSESIEVILESKKEKGKAEDKLEEKQAKNKPEDKVEALDSLSDEALVDRFEAVIQSDNPKSAKKIVKELKRRGTLSNEEYEQLLNKYC